MNWKLALKKRWLELLVAVVWLASAVVNGIRGFQTSNWEHWLMCACAIGCTVCWVFIFYKRAKRDGA